MEAAKNESARESEVWSREFESWVIEHQAGLRAFIRALGMDEAWVDDVAQETFLVAYRRLNEFDRNTDFGKWLRRIARFLVANERRKATRHSQLLPLAVADVLMNQGLEHELRQDLQHHLVLWETWSQSQAPERSAEAFVAAFPI